MFLHSMISNMSRDMTNPTKWLCAQRRLRSAWASAQSDQSSLCAKWVGKGPSFLHADSEDSDQTGRMPRLIWVFAGCTATLLVLSCCGSYVWIFAVKIKKHTQKTRTIFREKQDQPNITQTLSLFSSSMILFSSKKVVMVWILFPGLMALPRIFQKCYNAMIRMFVPVVV